MQSSNDRASILYGTDQMPDRSQPISFGKLAFWLEGGNLRWISYDGLEVLRGLGFLARDVNWAVCPQTLSDIGITEEDHRLVIRFGATVSAGTQRLDLDARIEVRSDRSLVHTVEGYTETGFDTNRTGFNFLLPSEALEGKTLVVEHTDGTEEETAFPTLVMPAQPAMDIAGLKYSPSPEIEVRCAVDDDAYELEDQRNWSDASFKAYYRPLAKPRPYRLEPGSTIKQSFAIDIRPQEAAGLDQVKEDEKDGPDSAITVPDLALWINPDDLPDLQAMSRHIVDSGAARLICGFDPRSTGQDALAEIYRLLSRKTGLSLTLETVLPLRDASGDFTDSQQVLEADVAAIKRFADKVGSFDQIMAVPECYRHSYQPSETWPKCPDLDIVDAALRRAFPEAEIGGGMHSYFTELNRKPPSQRADFVFHSFCPIVHAADDATVMENLRSLHPIGVSARAMLSERPYWIGPSGISMRFNPYGAAPVPNPDNVRVAMSEADPRMRGLFGAAWALGTVVEFTKVGAAGLCLASLSGGNACLRADGEGVYPIYLVLAGLGPLRGAPVSILALNADGPVAALRIDGPEGAVIWIANLSDAEVSVDQAVSGNAQVTRLNTDTARQMCAAPDRFDDFTTEEDARTIRLDSYEVVRLATAK